VYQYQFQEVKSSRRGFRPGKDFIYLVSVDRKTMFPIGVFLSREAVDRWAKQNGRALSGTEEYAIAKMRLFRAFDKSSISSKAGPELVIDDTNLSELLAQLDL